MKQDKKDVTCGDVSTYVFIWNFSAATDAENMMHFAGALLQLASKVLIADDSVSDP